VSAKRENLDVLLLEAGPEISYRWRSHYDRLHLHGERKLAAFPGSPIPPSYGRWVGRDDYATYLQGYLATSGVEVALNKCVEHIDRRGDVWQISVGDEQYLARQVVVATGINRTPKIPDWPGLETFTGELLHSGEYKNADPYVGKDVLVVGVGNSGAEIAADLFDGGAKSVSVSYHNPPVIVPRSFGKYISLSHVLRIVQPLPDPILDRIVLLLHRLSFGDLSKYGLPKPEKGIVQRMRVGGAPIVNVSFVEHLKADHFNIVPAVERFDGAGVFCGGRRLTPDVVIAATGWYGNLEPIVGHLGVLTERGMPKALAPESTLHGLYFLGYDALPPGLLWRMTRRAPQLAETARKSVSQSKV
jgi:putative flavoprotein involved in K+ transport